MLFARHRHTLPRTLPLTAMQWQISHRLHLKSPKILKTIVFCAKHMRPSRHKSRKFDSSENMQENTSRQPPKMSMKHLRFVDEVFVYTGLYDGAGFRLYHGAGNIAKLSKGALRSPCCGCSTSDNNRLTLTVPAIIAESAKTQPRPRCSYF